jgi:iron complex outermembrane receptor protein
MMNRTRPPGAALAVFVLLAAGQAGASEPDATAQVDAESPRSPRRLLEAPLSIAVVDRREILPTRPALGLEEALDVVPGLFSQSSNNFAQDTRISIRGFGARSSFGIRGVRILVDGVPNTFPDGQTEVDSLDLAFVDRIEVIRGPISSLYGGGGGGVITVKNLEPTREPEVRLRSLLGSDHLSRYEGTFTGTVRDTGVVLGVTRTRYGGHRDHSRGEQSNLLAKLERTLPDGTEIGLGFNGVWAPEGQDPGGLTESEMDEDPKQAAPRNRIFDAGERLNQQRYVVRARRQFGPGRELRLSGYYTRRDFRNKLPFEEGGRVDLDRRVSGGSLLFTQNWGRVRGLLGLDGGYQSDYRKRYDNIGGSRGELRLRQAERVRSVGPFGEIEVDLGEGFSLVGGLRYDWVEFDVDDRFDDGSASGDVRFRETSPRIAIRYGRSNRLNLYANLATSFQVPTTTELAPAGGGRGFNRDIDPERSVGLEAGAKGILSERLVYDIALFALRVRDVLVPFEGPSGRTLFRNAAKTHRKGAEAGITARLLPELHLRAAYTYMDARYNDYDLPGVGDFDGNHEPNIPDHLLTAELRYTHSSGLFAIASVHHQSDIYVNDANTEEADSATTSDLRIGFERVRGMLRLTPFVGLRNWTDVDYAGTIRPNAAFGRYYEPAPGIQAYGGLSLEFSR